MKDETVDESTEAALRGLEDSQPTEPTEEELKAKMDEALKSGDFKLVAKVASELVKFQKAREQAELEAKQKVLQEQNAKVMTAIQKALKPIYEAGELDRADGVWFGWEFGAVAEKGINPYCRLIKTAPRKGGGGGGGGKKIAVSSTDLLVKYGDTAYKDTGMTFQQAWDSNPDKNWRYAIREALLKADGLIS